LARHDTNVLSSFLQPLSLEGLDAPFLVFADWLQARGDAWGELIAIDCAIEQEAASAASLVRDRERLLAARGHEICALHRWEGTSITYRRGFIVAVSFGDCANADERKLAQQLNELCWLPAATFLERLSFSSSTLRDERAGMLLAEKSRLSKLNDVDLRGNLFSDAMVLRRDGDPTRSCIAARKSRAAAPAAAGALRATFAARWGRAAGVHPAFRRAAMDRRHRRLSHVTDGAITTVAAGTGADQARGRRLLPERS
jgi:hypothetical protein